jgi:hypothetical protein
VLTVTAASALVLGPRRRTSLARSFKQEETLVQLLTKLTRDYYELGYQVPGTGRKTTVPVGYFEFARSSRAMLSHEGVSWYEWKTAVISTWNEEVSAVAGGFHEPSFPIPDSR